MPVMNRSVQGRLAVAVVLTSALVGCSPSAQAVDASDLKVTAAGADCPRESWGSHPTDARTNENRTAYADLDCDGAPDSITVAWVKEDGKLRPMVTIAGSATRASRLLDVDGLPELIQFADIDGDGIRDLLLATVDESTVFPAILLVKADQLISPRDGADVNWRELQYVWAEGDKPESCEPYVLPKVVMDSTGPAVLVAMSSPRSPLGCTRATTKKLRVKAGVLTVQ